MNSMKLTPRQQVIIAAMKSGATLRWFAWNELIFTNGTREQISEVVVRNLVKAGVIKVAEIGPPRIYQLTELEQPLSFTPIPFDWANQCDMNEQIAASTPAPDVAPLSTEELHESGIDAAFRTLYPPLPIAEQEQIRKRMLESGNSMFKPFLRLVASLDAEREKSARLEAESAALRAIFPRALAALDNGSGCTESVSLEFLQSIPDEISQAVTHLAKCHVEALRELAELKAALQLLKPISLPFTAMNFEGLLHEMARFGAPGSAWVPIQDAAKLLLSALEPKPPTGEGG
jgi:hypothetical protein